MRVLEAARVLQPVPERAVDADMRDPNEPDLDRDVNDPQGAGRVRVAIPGRTRTWARLATASAASERGSWFAPDPGDEVLVLGGVLGRGRASAPEPAPAPETP